MIINAKGPASFAEKYIVRSIWDNKFPPGSILPAERELSELIGVTRTTLREVLQRLARDGWLKIQHGKPTQVNNFWETSGLNILETIADLNPEGFPLLVDQLMSARANVSTIYFRASFRHNPEKAQEILSSAHLLSDDAEAYADFDYRLHHKQQIQLHQNYLIQKKIVDYLAQIFFYHLSLFDILCYPVFL